MATTNIYHAEQSLRRDLYGGKVPLGSIIHVKWPSGNGSAIRFHGINNRNWRGRAMIVGCEMGWDNGATEWHDLSSAFIEGIERPKQKKCGACNKLVYMWHHHAMWCKPDKHYPEYPTKEQS